MAKYLLVFLIFSSCTDKEEAIKYLFKNDTDKNFDILLFDNSIVVNSTMLLPNESVELYSDKPPFDGPFAGFDSIKLAFNNGRELTYVPLINNDSCGISNKNPFCSSTYHDCDEVSCTFIIDFIEYLKAR